MRYVLIDLENVQPKDLAVLQGHSFTVLVFVGAAQRKLPLDLAQAMQALGEGSKYVQVSGDGRNALDFHIAFTMGRLSQANAEASFHVVSKDRGFDPLIAHLKTNGINAARVSELTEIPLLRNEKSKPTKEKVEAIAANLRTRGTSRPRKVKTLKNTINALYGNGLSEAEKDALVTQLQEGGHVDIEGERVSYNL